MRQPEWSMTYTGKIYWPWDPKAEDIDIIDIAHGLSNICRYGGQCHKFYSVAEHSWIMSYMVPAEFAFEALLHDGAEAYINDMTVTLKRNMPAYQDLDALNDKVLRHKFGLPALMSSIVKSADAEIVVSEYAQLFPPIPAYLNHNFRFRDPGIELSFWRPRMAEMKFLKRYNELKGVANGSAIQTDQQPTEGLSRGRSEDRHEGRGA